MAETAFNDLPFEPLIVLLREIKDPTNKLLVLKLFDCGRKINRRVHELSGDLFNAELTGAYGNVVIFEKVRHACLDLEKLITFSLTTYITKTFVCNAFNFTYKPEFDPEDVVSNVSLMNELNAMREKYGFKNILLPQNTIDPEKIEEGKIDEFEPPPHVGQLTIMQKQEIRVLYKQWLQGMRVLEVISNNYADAFFSIWINLRLVMFMTRIEVPPNHTISDLLAPLPSLSSYLYSLRIEKKHFMEHPDFGTAPHLMLVTTFEMTNTDTRIEDATLGQCMWLLQLFRVYKWRLPILDLDWLRIFHRLNERFAILMKFIHPESVLDAYGTTQTFHGGITEDEQDKQDESRMNETEDERKQREFSELLEALKPQEDMDTNQMTDENKADIMAAFAQPELRPKRTLKVVTLYTRRIIKSTLTSMWRMRNDMLTFRHKFREIAVLPQNATNIKEYLVKIAMQSQLSTKYEQQRRRHMLELYVSFGFTTTFKYDKPTRSADPGMIVPTFWGGEVFFQVEAIIAMKPFEFFQQKDIANEILFIGAMYQLHAFFDNFHINDFVGNFMLSSKQLEAVNSTLTFDDYGQKYPIFVNIGNIFGLVFRGHIYRAENNNPWVLLYYFFELICYQCDGHLANTNIRSMLTEMGMRVEGDTRKEQMETLLQGVDHNHTIV
jgi:hypothetical protein